MEREAISAGFSKVVHPLLGLRDHQVAIKVAFSVLSQCSHDRCTESQIRHEMAVLQQVTTARSLIAS